VVGPVGSAEV
jgi:hypothetical protein